MARLQIHSSVVPLSGEYNPQSLSFHAAKIALVENLLAQRTHTGMKVERDHDDGRTNLTIEGTVGDVINLLLTLHHHGAGLFQVEAEDQAELDEINKEFAGAPAVTIELADG